MKMDLSGLYIIDVVVFLAFVVVVIAIVFIIVDVY